MGLGLGLGLWVWVRVRVTGFTVCTCRKCVPFVAYIILVANTHKKDETFKMVRILRGNIIYDHLL
jgi:hypothetical protein